MLHYVFLILHLLGLVDLKYIEGVLNTKENWAFLTRFCFLSEQGQFEYHIEFNEDYGDVNLLLYYDTEDQWPAVYKTGLNCQDKENILNVGQNQIVNLTARYTSYREFSGCSFQPVAWTTIRPKYTLSVPTLPSKNFTRGKTTVRPNITTRATTTEMDNPTTAMFSTSPTDETTIITSETTESYSTLSTTENVNLEYEMVTALEHTTLKSLENDIILTNPIPIKKRSIQQSVPPIKNLRMGRTVSCHNARRFRSSRERWWYIAISNCNGTKGIHIKYRILMTNGLPGDYWHEHFSADEFYILPILMAFSIAYSFLLLGIIMCSLELKQRQLLHTTYKIFVLSVMFQLFGILLQSVVYLKYAVSGSSSPRAKRFGSMMMGASETTFLLLLLLLAKGYTITRGRLPISASVKLTIFMCLYTITYVSIYIYEAQVFDPGEVLYLYESPAGYSLIILRIFAWFMFIYSTVVTLKRYPEKGNFYYPFNIFGTLWFVAGPAFILSANTYIDKWVRESVVCAVLLFITFGGHLMFLLLTMPSVANKNFPYHVRTTQIGIMEMTGGTTGAGTSTIEHFGHHVYEPSVIIPLTRRTEEIFEGMYSQQSFRRRDYPNEANNLNLEPLALETEMQNVLSWSSAKTKTPNALEHDQTENDIENDVNGELQVPFQANGHRRYSSSNQSVPEDEHPNSGYITDYVRDVPIELFTVSKMVVTAHRRGSIEQGQ